MGGKVRFVVRWTDEANVEQTEICEGVGAYLKAIALRDRLPEQSGAFVTREELVPVWTWVADRVVEDVYPRRGEKATAAE